MKHDDSHAAVKITGLLKLLTFLHSHRVKASCLTRQHASRQLEQFCGLVVGIGKQIKESNEKILDAGHHPTAAGDRW